VSDPEDVAGRIYARRQPASDPDAQRYLLSAEQGIRIFQEEIVPDLLTGSEPQARPTVVFLVGQHGAGKSRVARMVAGALNKRGGFVDLDSDLYKPYHPEYDDLMSRNDTLMAAYVGPDSWAWLAQANEYVRTHRINVLKPETGQHQGAAANIRAYREAGFRIEVMVLGVPAAMSNLGIVSRYHEQVVDRGHGRLTVQANADRAYKGILELADIVDDEMLADEVGVFRRGEAVPRYSNSLNTAGQWQTMPALRAAIESERARAWTAEETADFMRTQAKLRHELGSEWTQRLDVILMQAEPLIDRHRQPASELPAANPDPSPAAEPGVGDDIRQALDAARAAAFARQSLQRRQAAAEAAETDRRQAARWQATAAQQREASWQAGHGERDPGAEAEACI
jgi:energy-coupling factor transporter ATP-binding protein EcfA2